MEDFVWKSIHSWVHCHHFCHYHHDHYHNHCSDRLQSGRSELAGNQWRGFLLSKRRELSDKDFRSCFLIFSSPFSSSSLSTSSIPSWLSAGSFRCLRSPPRHLYLHHVLLLHEKGEDNTHLHLHAIIKLFLVPTQVILQNQKERDCRGSTIFRG